MVFDIIQWILIVLLVWEVRNIRKNTINIDRNSSNILKLENDTDEQFVHLMSCLTTLRDSMRKMRGNK